MGHYLPKPIREKSTEEGKVGNIHYAASSMQGWRVSMEDAHIIHPNLEQGTHLFAVFDGHGGSAVAEYCSLNFARVLKDNKYYQRGAYSDALKSSFLEIDQEMRDLEGKKRLQNLSGRVEGFGGCTANVMLVVGDRIYIANAGDSRAVLYSNGKVIKLSYDHKPDNKEEYDRITHAGGFVTQGRVCGNLNLSRALGDFEFKQNRDLTPERQMISAMPDVTVRILEAADQFVVLGCDGIWELMTDQEVCQVIETGIRMEEPLGNAIEEVLERGLAKDVNTGFGCDNMSCLVVRL